MTDTMTTPAGSVHRTDVRYLLHDGELVEYADAKLHVLTTTLKYGVGVFEGFRAYWSEEDNELYAFRVQDHMRRLVHSMRVADIRSLMASVVAFGAQDTAGGVTSVVVPTRRTPSAIS